jgi:imidazolonepropionase-like amidohydrolase
MMDSLRKEEDTVAAIVRAGGVVLAGTDSPLDSVATALHLNLRAQVKFGLEPWQALQTATLFPARAFGVAKDLGTLEPGKIADLAIVSGDPLHDIKDAANVQFVMKSGKLYSVSELMAPFAH